MKTIINKTARYAWSAGLVLFFCLPMLFTSCKEDISEDAYAVAQKQTIWDMVSTDPETSDLSELFKQVKLGLSDNASVLSSVLSSRGNYTLFAPTNEAIRQYIKEETGNENATIDDLDQEHKERIALNCIIDNGDQSAYELSDFPSNGTSFAISNLKERRLSSQQVNGEYLINGVAQIIAANMEASNGMYHKVNHVIAPSNNSVAELVMQAPNMRIMGKLLEETGWADYMSLKTAEENDFERSQLHNAGNILIYSNNENAEYMTTRKVGYTAFVETDKVFHDDWEIPEPNVEGETITNWTEIKDALVKKIASIVNPALADITDAQASQLLYDFVAYHIMDGGLDTRKFVRHWNEYNYDRGADLRNPSTRGYTVDVWDYYTTKANCLFKLTQVATGENDFYINRISEYDNTFEGDYHEISTVDNNGVNGLNIKISPLNSEGEGEGAENYDNNAANGFYYPIDHVMVLSDDTRDALGGERMRIDFTTFFPEFISNNLRANTSRYFPHGYFEGIMNESNDTKITYICDGWHNRGYGNWMDYQGDEFLIVGKYDFIVKLPPVPKDGMYELRLGCSNNDQRSMVQVYLGTNPDATDPVGLPIDQRETVSMIPGNPWVSDDDSNNDEAIIRENDRNLRNQGYMKGPQYYCRGGQKDVPVRNFNQGNTCVLRRILKAQRFEAGKTYYLRFKSALESANTQLFLDYIELVPNSIYNSDEPEDIW